MMFGIDGPDSLENIYYAWAPEVKHCCPKGMQIKSGWSSSAVEISMMLNNVTMQQLAFIALIKFVV